MLSPGGAERMISLSRILSMSMGTEKVLIGEYVVDQQAEKKAETLVRTSHPELRVLTTIDGKRQIPLHQLLLIEDKYQEEIKAAHAKGLEEGRAMGYDSGHNDGQAIAREVVNSLSGLVGDVTRQRAQLLGEARDHIFEMVTKISHKLTFGSAAIDPEITRAIISGAIDQLLDKSKIKIKVNPDHLPELEQHIDHYLGSDTAIKEISIEADPRVKAGGCFIETPSGDIDARLESMFEIIKEAILDEEGASV